jgi:hypothetical protein
LRFFNRLLPTVLIVKVCDATMYKSAVQPGPKENYYCVLYTKACSSSFR